MRYIYLRQKVTILTDGDDRPLFLRKSLFIIILSTLWQVNDLDCDSPLFPFFGGGISCLYPSCVPTHHCR